MSSPTQSDKTVEEILAAFDEHTRYVLGESSDFDTGIRLDYDEAIAALTAREKRIRTDELDKLTLNCYDDLADIPVELEQYVIKRRKELK